MSETIQHVIEAALALFREGDVIEVRVPKAGKEGTIAGYFNDVGKMAAAVAQLEARKFPGIYWTLNPVLPDLLARADNRTKPYMVATTTDQQIVHRYWLPVDLDPARPSGISSSDEEKAAARELAEQIIREMSADGWPEPLFADSGNGYHLLWRIDLPNDPLMDDMCKRALHALAERFDNDRVKVDKTIFNAARIFKVYGTTSRKGDHTESRPHRLSHLLSAPKPIALLSHDQIRVLASQATPPAVQGGRGAHRGGAPGAPFDLEAFLSKYGVRYRPPVPWDGGRKYVLLECPFDPSHKAPDSMVFEQASGALGFKCLHNSCADYAWREFRERFEGPRKVHQRPYVVPSPGRASVARAPLPDTSAVPDVVVTGQKLAGEPLAEESGESGEKPEPPDLLEYMLTDSGNGERIVAMFGRSIRYCTEMKSWFIWDGMRWAVDNANLMRQKAMEMARLLYYQASKLPDGARRTAIDKHARASESSKGITNALVEAQRMRGIPVSANQLDQHHDFLNFLNGTVDLRDGSSRPHDPEMLITKLVDYSYRPDAKAPTFQAFVEWAMGAPENPEAELSPATVGLLRFIQRVIGYSITGITSEKAVFVFYGADGNNGKTTLLNLFREILGRDYASMLLIETIMHARSTDNTAREDMADLRGTRFVQTSEVGKEDRLNEQRIKFLTQGMGTIKSRRLHEHLVEFEATHKLLMDCNYRPKVSGQDNAIWRRLKQVPFEVTISDEQKDLHLPEKLRKEAEGVLAWAVRGSMEWYKHGLGDPPAVAEAQADWREHDDPIREFLSDWCDVSPEVVCPVADLMSAYLLWAKEFGEKFPLARRTFNEALGGKGIKQDRLRIDGVVTRIWKGVELKVSVEQKLQNSGGQRFND